MSVNIFVANIDFGVSSENLKGLFMTFGEVTKCDIVKDKVSGRSKGFGFVEMPHDSEARAAIKELNDRELRGRAIKVQEARPKTDN